MANTVSVSALTEAIDVRRDELIVKSATSSKTAKYAYTMLGVKHKSAVPTLESEIVLQDGSVCGWDPAGSDVFGKVEVEVFAAEVEKEFCQREFENTWLNYQLRWAAGLETLPVEDAIINSQLAQINLAVEKGIWQGIAAIGLTGYTDQLDALSAVTTNVSFGTGDTMTDKIDSVVDALSQDALSNPGGVEVFLSYTDFRKYVREQNASCCANRAVIDAASEELAYLGDSRVKLIPVAGLENQGYIVAVPYQGLVYATDIENSENIYDFWFDRKEAKFLFRVLFMLGVAIRYPSLTVVGK